MAFGLSVWIFVLIVTALIWASRHMAVNRTRRDEKPLRSDSYSAPPSPAPALSVLVAAKDEQDNIGDCVSTLLDQDYPDFEVIAINDRSTDRTPTILDQLQQGHGGRYQVVHVDTLQEGWFGKNNAMREGVERARGQWLCFTDADCRQISKSTLTVAMCFAIDNKIDFLSVLPVLETRSFWERVIQPVCAAVMVMWFRPERVNNPNDRASYANGAFMLMRRETYDAIGGHERVKSEVNEDMHMARIAKSEGQRLHVIQNKDLYRTRMYANFAETWRGWSRIFYGCFGNLRRLIISAIVLFVASIFPWLSLAISAVCWLVAGAEHSAWQWVFWLSVVTVAMQQLLLIRFYRLTQADARYVPTYLLGALIAFGALVNAMFKLGGRTTTVWRGTTYRGNQLVGAREARHSD